MKDIFIGCEETVFYPGYSNFRTIIQKKPYKIKAHWHPCIEIIMPFSGNYKVVAGEESVLLRKGDIIILHSGTIHQLSGTDKGTRLIFQFDIELLYSLKEFQSLLFSFPSYLVLHRDMDDNLYKAVLKILLEITEESRHKNLLWESSLYSLILRMYTLLFRSPLIPLQSLPDSGRYLLFENLRYQEKFLSVCQYINQNLSSPLSLEDAATYAGFSKYHFSRLFKDFLGMSFSRYLTCQRVHKAKLLLLTTDASITDIALESGFNSSSTFNRSFYEEEGMSPSAFRSSHALLKN